MTDAWTDPPDRVFQERISETIWNTNIAANLRLLGLHDHLTGNLGNGALLPNTTPKTGSAIYFMPPYPGANAVNGVMVSVANQVRFFRFYISFRLALAFITCEVNTLAAGSTLGVGVYNNDGTILLASGTASSASTGVKRVAMTPSPVDLLPDFYYLAWTNTGNVAQTGLWGNVSTVQDILNDTGVSHGTAANASAAGVLPATLGALTPSNLSPLLAKLDG